MKSKTVMKMVPESVFDIVTSVDLTYEDESATIGDANKLTLKSKMDPMREMTKTV